jgi:hypothetical protein
MPLLLQTGLCSKKSRFVGAGLCISIRQSAIKARKGHATFLMHNSPAQSRFTVSRFPITKVTRAKEMEAQKSNVFSHSVQQNFADGRKLIECRF